MGAPLVVAGVVAGVAVAIGVNEALGRPAPFLRWSFIRMMLGMKKLMTDWQVGDGREDAVADYVIEHARPGDVDHAIATIDEFAYKHSFLINVGDEKGAILDAAIERCQPRCVIEVGAYIGYSALRIASKLPPDGHLFSVELSADNAAIARRIVEHAGMGDRVTFVVGSIGDGGETIAALKEKHGLSDEGVDFVFLDHHKDYYLSDLKLLLDAGFLHAGSLVVADNVGFPGAPDYRAYMEEQEGKRWKTTSHATHVEYQSVVRDIVLESELLA